MAVSPQVIAIDVRAWLIHSSISVYARAPAHKHQTASIGRARRAANKIIDARYG